MTSPVCGVIRDGVYNGSMTEQSGSLLTSPIVSRLRDIPETIFSRITRLAVENNAINLGQGFPDSDGPRRMLEIASEQILSGNNQYAPGRGVPELRKAISANREQSHGQVFDPDTEVAVTVGATEGIAASILALVEPGSEVVLIEPYYDAYAAAVRLAGGHHVAVPLLPTTDEQGGPRWALDVEALRRTVSDNTRMIVVNTPHNPTGHVFTTDEILAISEVAEAHDCLVLSDEVYEHLVFSGARHVPVASVGSLRERTVTVSSTAKSFNATGWKTGWVMGPAPLVNAAITAKQYMSFVGATPFQPAVAYALREEADWVEGLSQRLESNYKKIAKVCGDIGMTVFPSDGSYFVVTDISTCEATKSMTADDFCLALPKDAGVAAIPVTAFVDDKEQYRTLIRWAFCNKANVIDDAIDKLTAWAKGK